MPWPADNLSDADLDSDADRPPRAMFRSLLLAVKAIIGERANVTIPPGTIVDFGGAAAPAGWLACDGQAVSQTAYPALYAVCGSVYGAAPSGQFRLPDLRRRIAMGAGGAATPALGAAVGARGGAETVRLTQRQMPAHRHFTAADGSSGQTSQGLHGLDAARAPWRRGDTGGDYKYILRGSTAEPTVGRTSAAGAGAAVGILPPVIVLRKIVKT